MGQFDYRNKRYISVIKGRFIPNYFQHKYPEFVSVVEAFLENLDKEDHTAEIENRYGAYALVRRIYKLVDIDETEDEFLEKFVEQYLVFMTKDLLSLVDVRLLVRKSKEFYSSKGKLKAFEFIFNIIDISATIYESQPQIMRLSEENHLASGAEKYTGPYVEPGYVETGYFEAGDPTLNNDYLDKFMRDNIKYAEYAYTIRTDEYPQFVREMVEKFVHPIGMSILMEYYSYIIGEGANGRVKADDSINITKGVDSLQDVVSMGAGSAVVTSVVTP